ncbi:hypothetical protein GZH47_32910 (plasmid) [Paenibacillus rhizovicinus]|uniref:Uncharacterized protein n=1 Tax=Paenibacillus rhizovicinus TaxID=2704463 RepID=A0A6C0PBG0_9BACL|nr:hypothetical protein [Paenibacillus rhizovicinus]QHW35695.1 hypothetical protein GZH47_32910 [Paenibacillus rhizovicinus]
MFLRANRALGTNPLFSHVSSVFGKATGSKSAAAAAPKKRGSLFFGEANPNAVDDDFFEMSPKALAKFDKKMKSYEARGISTNDDWNDML